MSLKGLFGIEPIVGKPSRNEPDWDETIHAETDDPANAAPTTGGRIISYRESLDLDDTPVRQSSWLAIDAWLLTVPVVVIGIIVILGFVVVVMSMF